MAEFTIQDSDLASHKGKVAIVTGGSSGIGQATVDLLLSLGASVVNADLRPPTSVPDTPSYLFVKTNVTNWDDLNNLFKKAQEKFGRVDSVLANAGVAPIANYIDLKLDPNGQPIRPTSSVIDINLTSVINTACLAVHYMIKAQSPPGGSLVLVASSTGLHPVRGCDYSSAKSGVWGFGGGFAKCIDEAQLPIKLSTIMPSWTPTNLLPGFADLLKAANHEPQTLQSVARANAYLMAPTTERHGEAVFISEGKTKEIQKSTLWPTYLKIRGEGPSDDEVMRRIYAHIGETCKA